MWLYKFFRYATFVWAYHSQTLINKSLYLRAVYEHQERRSPLNRFFSWRGRVSRPGISACVTHKFFSFPLPASPPVARVHWGIFELIIKQSGDEGSDGRGEKHHFPLALYTRSHHPSLALLACLARLRLQNSRVFFSKSVKKSVKRGVRVLRERSVRASDARLSRSLSAEASREPGERN